MAHRLTLSLLTNTSLSRMEEGGGGGGDGATLAPFCSSKFRLWVWWGVDLNFRVSFK